jgi:hypothetical protein
MRIRTREETRVITALAVMTVAILGYIVGHARPITVPVESTRETANAVTIVHYASASGWRPASAAPTVPGLSIAQSLVLAPNGDASHGGLVVGQLLGSESSPLPSQLLAHLPQLPETQVVALANTQAYRYSPLNVTGSGQALTLYTIPNSPTSTTAILCYASPGSAIYMHACERLAAGLTIAGGTPEGGEVRAVHPLTPEAGYGRRIAAAAARADQLLLLMRPAIRPGASRAKVSTLAGRLANGFAGVAKSLSAVHPPPAAERVHAALSASLGQARAAYAALGSAVSAGNAAAYATARTDIVTAEAGLSGALRNFALLGYG